jgi:hypothetical protein
LTFIEKILKIKAGGGAQWYSACLECMKPEAPSPAPKHKIKQKPTKI